MNDNLPSKTTMRNSFCQAGDHLGDGTVGHTEPKYIGLEAGLSQGGKWQAAHGFSPGGAVRDYHLVQRDFRIRQSTCQRTAPVAEADDGDTGLHTGWYFKIVRPIGHEGAVWRARQRVRTARKSK